MVLICFKDVKKLAKSVEALYEAYFKSVNDRKLC